MDKEILVNEIVKLNIDLANIGKNRDLSEVFDIKNHVVELMVIINKANEFE